MATRDSDPYGGFRFRVEILGLQVGGFSEISGLDREVTLEDFREGGVNGHTHKLATVTKYPNKDVWRWVFEKAFPVKWSGASFNAATSAVFVESVEFAHDGVTKG